MCNARRLLSPLIGGAFALSLAALAPLFTGCGGDDAAAAIGHDGGATQSDFAAPAVADLALGPPQGTIDPMGGGGTVNLLAFTVFGDVRPALPDFDNQYPAMTIASIMKQMATLSPEFAVGTGDYMFVEALPSSATNQLKMLLAAEANFPKPIFHALGNHECNSFSDLNCPNLNETPNITVYMSTMLPWTKVPWYSFLVHTALGDAKFLFVAANAWNDQQAAWLKQALSIPTRYTFVIRHQPTPDAGQPSSVMGKLASDMLFMGQPITLFLYGHVHEYNHIGTNAVIAGNGGAPLDKGSYGFVYVRQREDGAVTVTAYDVASMMPMDAWNVTPDGQSTP